MMQRVQHCEARQANRSGLGLVEVAVSTLMVGLIVVGAMRCVGGAVRGRLNTNATARAQHLGQQLLTEILSTAYIEPTSPPAFGPENGEPAVNTGTRDTYDDVDDFHLWSESPPKKRTGAALADFSGWGRSVVVAWVNAADPANTSLTDQGLKRITVTVTFNGLVVKKLVALRGAKYVKP